MINHVFLLFRLYSTLGSIQYNTIKSLNSKQTSLLSGSYCEAVSCAGPKPGFQGSLTHSHLEKRGSHACHSTHISTEPRQGGFLSWHSWAVSSHFLMAVSCFAEVREQHSQNTQTLLSNFCTACVPESDNISAIALSSSSFCSAP